MSPLRFSLTTLAIVIALCGVGFASLASPSVLWANALFTLALGTLVTALTRVLYLRGTRRAFWAGFTLWGWAYFLAVFGPWAGESIGPHLLTTAMLDIAYARIAPPAPTVTGLRAMAGGSGGMPGMIGMTGMGGYAMAMMGTPAPAAPEPSRWAAWTEPDRSSGVGQQVGRVALVSPGPFRRIGHSLLMLLIASIGGLLTRSAVGDRQPTGGAPG